jgi:hypothetical protein
MRSARHAEGRRRARARAALAVALVASLGGCAAFHPPEPWEKGELAKPQMQFDPKPLEARAREHIYQSKEGAGGGYGVGGGGCGCN